MPIEIFVQRVLALRPQYQAISKNQTDENDAQTKIHKMHFLKAIVGMNCFGLEIVQDIFHKVFNRSISAWK